MNKDRETRPPAKTKAKDKRPRKTPEKSLIDFWDEKLGPELSMDRVKRRHGEVSYFEHSGERLGACPDRDQSTLLDQVIELAPGFPEPSSFENPESILIAREELAERVATVQRVREAVKELRPLERSIIQSHWLSKEPVPLAEIARRHGLNRSAINQAHAQAFAHLRLKLDRRKTCRRQHLQVVSTST